MRAYECWVSGWDGPRVIINAVSRGKAKAECWRSAHDPFPEIAYTDIRSRCHMVSDSLPELHEMADKIGLKREWFQDLKIPHYDMVSKNRAKAIKLGAVVVTSRFEFRYTTTPGIHKVLDEGLRRGYTSMTREEIECLSQEIELSIKPRETMKVL